MQSLVQHSPLFTTTWTSTCTGDFAVSTQPVMPYHETPAAEKALAPSREGELTESAQTLACDPLPNFWPGQETFADHPPVPTEFVVETADGQGVFAVGNTVLIGTPKTGKSTFLYGGLIAGITKRNGIFRIRGNVGGYSAAYVTAQEDPSGNISSLILGGDGNTWLVTRTDAANVVEDSSDPIGDYLKKVDQQLTSCPDCKLVVTDTLAKLAAALNFSITNAKLVRKLLDGTQRLGEKHKVAFLWIHHLNKDDDRKALSAKIAGSGQILAAVRALWVYGTHPKDDQLRVLAYYKGNLLTVPNSLVCRRNLVPYKRILAAAKRNPKPNAPFIAPPEEEKYYEVALVDLPSISAEELTRKPARKTKVEADQEGAGWDDSLCEDETQVEEVWTNGPSAANPPASRPVDSKATMMENVGTKAPNRRDKNAPKVAAALVAQILTRFKASPEMVLTSKEVKAAMQNAGLKKSWYPKLSRRLQEEGLEFGKCRHEGTMCTIWLKPIPGHGQKPSVPHMASPRSSGTMAFVDLGYGPVGYMD